MLKIQENVNKFTITKVLFIHQLVHNIKNYIKICISVNFEVNLH